jgi:hypothetical protein
MEVLLARAPVVRLARRSEGNAVAVQQRLVGWVGLFLRSGSSLRTGLRGRLLWRRAEHQEVNDVVHILIVLALILFVLWLLFHATGALVNLLWIGIVVLAIFWLVGLFRGRSKTI